MIHSLIVQACQCLAQAVPGLYNGLVVPYHNPLAVQSYGMQQDNRFYAPGMGSVQDIVVPTAGQDLPGSLHGVLHPFIYMNLVMPDDIIAVLL